MITGKGGIASIRTANKLPSSPASSETISSESSGVLARVGIFVTQDLIIIIIRKKLKAVIPCFMRVF